MSSINSMHQANAQALAQMQQLAQIAATAEQAQTEQTVKLAKLHATEQVQATTDCSNKAALDTLV